MGFTSNHSESLCLTESSSQKFLRLNIYSQLCLKVLPWFVSSPLILALTKFGALDAWLQPIQGAAVTTPLNALPALAGDMWRQHVSRLLIQKANHLWMQTMDRRPYLPTLLGFTSEPGSPVGLLLIGLQPLNPSVTL